MRFLGVLKVAQKKERYHWIPEAMLHLIDTFFVEIYQYKNLTSFDLTLTLILILILDLYCQLLKLVLYHTDDTVIEFYDQNWPENMCRTTYITF